MRTHFIEPGGPSHTLCGATVATLLLKPATNEYDMENRVKVFEPREAEEWSMLIEATDSPKDWCTVCGKLLLGEPDDLGHRSFDPIQSALRRVRRDRRAGEDV